MVNRRAFLLGTASLSAVTTGCIDLTADETEFDISDIYFENRSTDPKEGVVAVERADDVVFMDSVEITPGEWDGDRLRREGGATVEDPVDGEGAYEVHVRIDDGPIHTTTGERIEDDGVCVSIRPVIGRDGGFHFEYAFESDSCN